MLYLGAAFVGVGLIWLVAANLDQFPPFGRFLVVTALWLGVTAVAEVLASRRRPGHGRPAAGRCRPRPLRPGVRRGGLPGGAVPAGPRVRAALVGVWGLGALLYAYAVRGVAPLLVGLVASLVWFLWHVGENGGSGLGVVLALLVAAAVAAGVAVLHDRFGPAEFAAPWREVGRGPGDWPACSPPAVPYVHRRRLRPDPGSWVALVVGVAAALVAAGLARGEARLEPLVALAVGWSRPASWSWDPGTDPGTRWASRTGCTPA